MNILVLILIVLSFFQAAFLPLNLVFIILLVRSFITDEKVNLGLAFFFGLLHSFLLGYPLGSLSLIYILAVAGIKIIKKAQFAQQSLVIFPMVIFFLAFDKIAEKLFLKVSFDFKEILLETVLAVPLYFLIRFWEERFVPEKGIKLKMGK